MEQPLTSSQQEAFDKIKDFLGSDSDVFVLKGYAGTGKTTLVKALLPLINQFGKRAQLMAPTGRAAKVLSEKAGCPASTIHRAIYSYEKMLVVRHDDEGNVILTNLLNQNAEAGGKSSDADDLQFWFSLRKLEPGEDPSKRVIIVDESSMVGSHPTPGEMLHFGTDILIDDLITYAHLEMGGKVIFVGDPAQLPPVGDNRSVALDESYFIGRGIKVESFTLTDIIRQGEDSIILKNAMLVRDLINGGERTSLEFERKQGEVMDITPEEAVEKFCELQPQPSIGESVIVAYSNAMVREYNDAIRRRYFPGCDDVVPNDILQVVKNNVNPDLRIELYNGDLVRVLNVSSIVESQSAPVWIGKGSERKQIKVTVHFRDAELMTDSGEIVKCKIIDDLLHNNDRALGYVETIALYINLRMRHPGLKPNEEAFKETIKNDPYFNAVQVKFGYAITGHKSQGGEWKTVFVDYSGRLGLNDDSLRWNYTATTRAQNALYGINMPNFKPLDKLSFSTITKCSKMEKEALAFAPIGDVQWLKPTATIAQKYKCLSAKESLEANGYMLASVDEMPYRDRYSIITPNGSQLIVDCIYNGSGMYTSYEPKSITPVSEKIVQLLKSDEAVEYKIEYKPSTNALAALYSNVTSICDDLNIKITNIVEHTPQFHVAYYLKTSGHFSHIKFFFKGTGVISRAMPFSDLGTEDVLLQKLIEKLQ